MEKIILTNMCLIENKKTKEVLTINRVKDWCGVAFPGGHIEEGEPIVLSVIREIKEEVNLNVIDYTYNDNEYYQPSNTLMHNYAVVVDSEDFKLTNEVDEAHWYSIEEARKEIKQGSLAHSFLERYLKKQH